MAEERRLGAWDCPYCDTKKILGNVFDCPGCGHPRPCGIHFYQIPNAPIVTPEIAEQLGSGGPNWYCEHCNSGNKDNNTYCWKCGAERGSSPSHVIKNYLQGEHVPQSTKEAKEAEPNGKSWVEYTPPISANTNDQKLSNTYTLNDWRSTLSNNLQRIKKVLPQNIDSRTIRPYLIGTAITIAAILIGILIYQFFFNTHDVMVQVSGFNWTQNVVVQEYQIVHEDSWSSHPSAAYNVDSVWKDTGRDQKIHDGWKTVSYQDICYRTETYSDICTGSRYVSRSCTGTRDNGDGSFSSYTYECGGSESYTYSCTKTRQEPYTCTKTRQEELYHYEDIYDWYYTYDINKWVTIANYPTSGDDHKPFFYSDFNLIEPYNGTGTPQLGQQQQFQYTGDYSVTFYCKSNTKVGNEGYFTREYSLGEWEMFDYEKNYPITINFFNKMLSYPTP